ncbi:hypothetical protein GDO78_006177 [Eleutherodactylus coqui]|uniref:Uncharacterized protein n=1 Tax=Eleutherodactylus coqui TaxID=57060 RepID=A0A8J6KFX1_ELECQ|nr:hypothetical protein GDO78_006177 [Eleutherodactylus coqui]
MTIYCILLSLVLRQLFLIWEVFYIGNLHYRSNIPIMVLTLSMPFNVPCNEKPSGLKMCYSASFHNLFLKYAEHASNLLKSAINHVLVYCLP